ncbi:MAG: non-heme iron oxygenase ferredoxin subunit [Acidimicrobiaceae bacterium]|nr:non-heme iron oxygenase ferredoxin subunit [Acidimicrobiaceae bacterium]MCY4280453.1 non-heme iron oxygenase ferredoxin subunit [Acidimicrobiaceae bacterium]MCY4295220.1 non-heme iron oxygenase ferredoxin subunit [Acidimicrobiaceae bacterium]
MTTETTHELFAFADLAPDTARRVEVAGRAVAVVRIGDDLYAIGDTCSHAEVSLSGGWIEPDECAIECEAHGALFDLRSGEALTLPATRPVPTYRVAVVDGMIVLTLGADGDQAAEDGAAP